MSLRHDSAGVASAAPALTVGSLFSGIGGIDLGLERARMRVIWQSEIDPYASRVLAKHWPNVPNLGDIKKIDWSDVERPNVICGGYPCQPFSQAGRRGGTDDERHLWPWMRDALRLLRPRYALLENVPGHLTLGFDSVLSDLAALGFDAEWQLLPAAAFGAPHLRYRLFVVAYANGASSEARSSDRLEVGPKSKSGQPACSSGAGDVAYANDQGSQGHRAECGLGKGGEEIEAGRCGDVANASSIGRSTRPRREQQSNIGPQRWDEPRWSDWWLAEPDVGRVAHGIPARMDRLKCLGNAVVPQVAEHVGRLIVEHDRISH